MTYYDAKRQRDELRITDTKHQYYIFPQEEKEFLAFLADFEQMKNPSDETVRYYTKDPNGFTVVRAQGTRVERDMSR